MKNTQNDTLERFFPPEVIYEKTGITRDRLTYYRKMGYLKKFKKTPGTNAKGGKYLYDLSEVKEVFFSA